MHTWSFKIKPNTPLERRKELLGSLENVFKRKGEICGDPESVTITFEDDTDAMRLATIVSSLSLENVEVILLDTRKQKQSHSPQEGLTVTPSTGGQIELRAESHIEYHEGYKLFDWIISNMET